MWLMALIVLGVAACTRPPLSKKKFTSLLIELHLTDGMLGTSFEHRVDEGDSYRYYNSLFARYGIERTDFDTILRYYMNRPGKYDKIYKVVIDTLTARKQRLDTEISILSRGDTVNLLEALVYRRLDTIGCHPLAFHNIITDTLWVAADFAYYAHPADTLVFDSLNPTFGAVADGIVPGKYTFSVTIKYDTLDAGRRNRIEGMFLSTRTGDTLRAQFNSYVRTDTLRRTYSWEYIVSDTIYDRLLLRFPVSENLEEVAGKRKGRIWGAKVNRVFVTPKEVERFNGAHAQRPR